MSKIITAAFVCLLTILPFIRTVDYGQVDLDDYFYTAPFEGEMGVEKTFSPSWAFKFCDEAIWMPLVWFDYRLDYVISGETAKSGEYHRTYRIMHLHSVLWHSASAVLLFLILLSILGANHKTGHPSRSQICFCALATLIWSVHPLRCEPVCWIASRKDVVSTFFLLATALFWIRYRIVQRQATRNDGPPSLAYSLSLVSLLLAGMAKPTVMTAPVLLFIVDRCFLGIRCNRYRLETWRPYVCPMVAGLLIAGIGWYVQRYGGGTTTMGAIPLHWRVLNAITSYGLYALHAVVPIDLVPQRAVRAPDLPDHFVVVAPIGVALLIFALWKAKGLMREFMAKGLPVESKTAPFAGLLLFFIVALVPMIGIIGFGLHASSDRFTHIPLIGVSLFLATCFNPSRQSRTILLAVAVAVYGALAAQQTGVWKNDSTLFNRMLEVDHGDNETASYCLGIHHYEYEHDLEAAAACFSAAVRKRESYRLRLGYIYVETLCAVNDRPEALRTVNALQERYVEREEKFYRDRSGRCNENPGADLKMFLKVAQLTYQMYDPQLRAAAESEVEELLVKHGENFRPLVYLKCLARKMSGDIEGARVQARKLFGPCATGGNSVIRYRFLKKELGI